MRAHVQGAFGRTAPLYQPRMPLPWIAPAPSQAGIGAEFLARAKRFRHEIMLGDAEALIDAHRLRDLVVATRRKQKSTLERRRHDRWVVREWPKQVSHIGRLGFVGDTDHGAGIRLLDTRLCGSWHQGPDWRKEEQSITIGTVVLRANITKVRLQVLPLVTVGIHALARFFSRSFDNSEEALIDALIVLQRSVWDHLTKPDGAEFSVDAGDGAWHGQRISIQTEYGERSLLRAQTYFCQE